MVDSVAVWQAIQTTFLTSGTATLLATIVGVPLGAWCARQPGVHFRRLKTMVTALYGLPPVVVGVFIYALFSKSGAFGGLDLLFTVEAMIIAQTVLIFPLVLGGAWTAFEGVGRAYSDTLSTLGIRNRTRLRMEIQLARNGVYHAVVIAFGRAIAEVGAVIMVGGNIAGKTRVMTTSIVLETSKGNMEVAGLLGLLLLLLSLLLVGLATLVQTRRRLVSVPLEGDDLPIPQPYAEKSILHCSVKKDGVDLLKGVEVTLAPGTVTVVVGESGAGKTTLLRWLAGLETEPVVCGPQHCVYVQQQPVLLSTTVGSELMLPRTWFNDLPPFAAGYARLFALEGKADQMVGELSGGERQRLVLARQLSLMPSLLLLDECTANLGWMHVQTIEKELLRLKKGGVCIVMATHSISQAHRLADRIIVLKDGAVVPHEEPYAQNMLGNPA